MQLKIQPRKLHEWWTFLRITLAQIWTTAWLTQISKTILGPFTHTRNFLTQGQFALLNGNLFKDPRKITENFYRAFGTIQPQLFSRNLPKNQAMAKFLIEKQRQLAVYYTERFIDYMSFNSALFPEYNTNSNGDVYPSSDSTTYTGWFLWKRFIRLKNKTLLS